MADFINGQVDQDREAEILSIDSKPNKNGLLTIKLVPCPPYLMPNKDGISIMQITADHLDLIARDTGCHKLEMLVSAIQLNPNDPSFLVFDARFCKEGETITDDEGNVVTSKRTGKTTFDKDFWNTQIKTIVLGDSAIAGVKEVVKDVQVSLLKDSMTETRVGYAEARRRRLQKSSGNVAQTGTPADVEATQEEAEDDVI